MPLALYHPNINLDLSNQLMLFVVSMFCCYIRTSGSFLESPSASYGLGLELNLSGVILSLLLVTNALIPIPSSKWETKPYEKRDVGE